MVKTNVFSKHGLFEGVIECWYANVLLWRLKSKILRTNKTDALLDAIRIKEDYFLTNVI